MRCTERKKAVAVYYNLRDEWLVQGGGTVKMRGEVIVEFKQVRFVKERKGWKCNVYFKG